MLLGWWTGGVRMGLVVEYLHIFEECHHISGGNCCMIVEHFDKFVVEIYCKIAGPVHKIVVEIDCMTVGHDDKIVVEVYCRIVEHVHKIVVEIYYMIVGHFDKFVVLLYCRNGQVHKSVVGI